VLVRYFEWIGNFSGAIWATPSPRDVPVSADVFTRLQRSLTLAGIAALIDVTGGILFGVFLAQRMETPTDFRCVANLLVLASIPEFPIGIALYLVFVAWLGWFPTQSAIAFSFGDFWVRAVTFVLPAATIALHDRSSGTMKGATPSDRVTGAARRAADGVSM